MYLPRRDFLKKAGLLTAAGFLSPPFGFGELQLFSASKLPAQEAFLIRDVQVLSMDDETGDHEKASVLVENGRIKEIAREILVPAGVQVIEGKGGILLPGLIDNHWHLWTSLLRSMSGNTENRGYFPVTARYSREYSPGDMKLAARYAAAEALNGGITTLNDFNHNARGPEYVMASFEALAEMGMRGHIAYGGHRDLKRETPTDFVGIQQVLEQTSKNPVFRNISLGLGARSVDSPFLEEDWKRARELGLPVAIHASSSKAGKGQIGKLAGKGLLGSDVNIIHGNAITDREIKEVSDSGAFITMTPFSEMRIGFGFPPVNKLKAANINLAVGVDSTALSGNADMFGIFKVLLNIANAKAESEFHLHPREILKMATIDAARLLGLEEITGSVTPGKRADLIMLRKNDLNFSSGKQPYHLIVEAARPENVELVTVDGRILKKNGKLQHIDEKALIMETEAALERMHQKLR